MEKQFTREGLEKLKKELEYLKNVTRKEMAERLKKSLAFGDLSENAEYIEAKESQAFLEGRITRLTNLIENAVVAPDQKMRGFAQIGSTILVQNKKGGEKFQLVGIGEVSPLEGKISVDSPLGKALLNQPEGAVVVVRTQNSKIEYKIVKII